MWKNTTFFRFETFLYKDFSHLKIVMSFKWYIPTLLVELIENMIFLISKFRRQSTNKLLYKAKTMNLDEMRLKYFQSLLLSTTMCSVHCFLWWHPFEIFWLIKLSGDFPHKLSSEGKSKSQSDCESWSFPTASGLFWTWTGWSEIFWFLSSPDINPDFSNIFGFKVSIST